MGQVGLARASRKEAIIESFLTYASTQQRSEFFSLKKRRFSTPLAPTPYFLRVSPASMPNTPSPTCPTDQHCFDLFLVSHSEKRVDLSLNFAERLAYPDRPCFPFMTIKISYRFCCTPCRLLNQLVIVRRVKDQEIFVPN